MMELFIAPNLEEKKSKTDGILYPYITKRGLPVAFEGGSFGWEYFGKNGDNVVALEDRDYIVSPRFSFKNLNKNNKKGSKMSFKLSSVQGTAAELETDLESPAQHEREEFVIGEVKKAIDHVVTALGGYLSVSANGNINPVSGETGDVVNIYVTSLPVPSVETPVTPTPEIPPAETSSVVESVPPAPIETPPINPENSSPTMPQVGQENAPGNPPIAPAVEPVTSGQAEVQDIAQETPPPPIAVEDTAA